MRITRRARQQIMAEAVDWFLQLQQAATAEVDRRSFSEWLLRSPAHVEEYLRVSSSWNLMNIGAEGTLEVGALITAARAHHQTDNVVALHGRLGRRSGRVGADSRRGLSMRKRRTAALLITLTLGIVLWAMYVGWRLLALVMRGATCQ